MKTPFSASLLAALVALVALTLLTPSQLYAKGDVHPEDNVKGDEILAERVVSSPAVTKVVSLVYVTDARGCAAWEPSAEKAIEQLLAKVLSGPWDSWKISAIDQGSLAGFLNTRRFGEISPPVLIAMDREGKVQSAYSSIHSGVQLKRILAELAAGRGTRTEVERRLATNPEDTQALWDLARLQMSCSALGSFELTSKRIAQLDPEHRSAGGESEFFVRSLMEFFMNPSTDLGSMSEVLAALENFRETIRQLQHPRVRSFANDHLVNFIYHLGNTELMRSLFLEAWKDRDPQDCEVLAVRIRENACWPQEGSPEMTEVWKEIDSVASAALQR